MHWSTERLSITSLSIEDAEELFEALDHPAVGAYLGGPDVTTLEALRARITRLLAGPATEDRASSWLNAVVRVPALGGRVVGRLEATVYPGWAEVAWVLGPDHWGRGYGTEGGRWLVGVLAGDYGVTDLWATVDPRNARSTALLRRLGFSEQPVPAQRMPESYEPGDLVFATR